MSCWADSAREREHPVDNGARIKNTREIVEIDMRPDYTLASSNIVPVLLLNHPVNKPSTRVLDNNFISSKKQKRRGWSLSS